ncbi:hypothetical protein F4X33_00470 [Candidatus Poribacteria bacterium]|nr:hypothetical protein [Candidatus Poribacteria bacterium]
MNCSYFKSNLISLITIVVLLFGTLSYSNAQEATSILSGSVVGVDGNPVAGLSIALQPFDPINEAQHLGYLSFLESQTDEEGRFSIANIVPVLVQLIVLPHDAPDYEILSVRIELVTIYQDRVSISDGIALSIKPGTHIKNVEIIAKPRLRIRGQVIFADGTPLANASVKIKARRRSPDGMGSGSSSSSARTDDAGYFVEYVHTPGIYTVTVNYRGLSATPKPFLLQEDERKDDVIFTFKGEPISPDSPGDRVEASVEASTSPWLGPGVWVVNPTNGHAYKSIHCKSWDDANLQAVAEEAYLVAINDADEQKWILDIFGYRPYWIGLTDFAEEGEWSWASGEPVTYTNWTLHEPMDAGSSEEDHVFMGHALNGEWSDISIEGMAWKFIQMAIIERNGPPGKTPVEGK